MLKLNPKKSTPLLFAVVTVVYGLLLPFTGFYWDDCAFAWIANFLNGRIQPALRPFAHFSVPFFISPRVDSTRADLLANLCSGHSPHHRTQRMVDVQTDLLANPGSD